MAIGFLKLKEVHQKAVDKAYLMDLEIKSLKTKIKQLEADKKETDKLRTSVNKYRYRNRSLSAKCRNLMNGSYRVKYNAMKVKLDAIKRILEPCTMWERK